MAEKTYHLAPYLGPTLFLSHPYRVQNDCWNVVVSSRYLASSKKKHYFGSKTTNRDYMDEKTYHLAQYLDPFMAYLMPQ